MITYEGAAGIGRRILDQKLVQCFIRYRQLLKISDHTLYHVMPVNISIYSNLTSNVFRAPIVDFIFMNKSGKVKGSLSFTSTYYYYYTIFHCVIKIFYLENIKSSILLYWSIELEVFTVNIAVHHFYFYFLQYINTRSTPKIPKEKP